MSSSSHYGLDSTRCLVSGDPGVSSSNHYDLDNTRCLVPGDPGMVTLVYRMDTGKIDMETSDHGMDTSRYRCRTRDLQSHVVCCSAFSVHYFLQYMCCLVSEDPGMITLDHCMDTTHFCIETSDHGVDTSRYRCSARPLPYAHSLCAPSAFLNRYRLSVVVSLPMQGHLSSSY